MIQKAGVADVHALEVADSHGMLPRQAEQRPGHGQSVIAERIEHHTLVNDQIRIAFDIQIVALDPSVNAQAAQSSFDGRQAIRLFRAQLAGIAEHRQTLGVRREQYEDAYLGIGVKLAEDLDGNLVVLFPTQWALDYFVEKNPKVTLHAVSPLARPLEA